MSIPSHAHTTVNPLPGIADNAWLSAVVANLPQGVILEDDKHNIQIVNLRLCHLFNLRSDPSELTGRRSADLFTELTSLFENPLDYSERIKILVREKTASHKEVVKLQDGRMLLRDYIPLSQDGIITGHLWMYSEETERIKAEALLQEQQKFYEDVLNSIPSDIAVFSPDHRYLYINPVGLRDTELRKWLIGKTDFDYCMMRGKDISFAQKRRDAFNAIVDSGKEKEWEERIVNRQGEVEYHLRKMSPLYDEHGQLVWMIGYSVNITERKKFEEKIQLSEKRYRDLFNYSQAIICTHDLKGNFLTVNPSMVEVMGYDEHEIIGRNLRDFLLPEDKHGVDDLYLKAFSDTNNKVKGLFRILNKAGKKVYLLYQNYKAEESPDSEAYIIAFSQDVSDRVKAEKELKVAKKITEETARNKERFLANMSHEIRTPMNGIIGITSFLQKTDLTEQQKNYMDIIDQSAHDLLTIINDILDLEKVGTGNIQLEKIPFDIINKTSTVTRLFELVAREKGIDIELSNTIGEDLFVMGDPTRFSQAMNNLISNAVKFTHEGKILIKAAIENETAENITLRFSVEDTGIGIDPANVTRIFQPFTQAYPETTRKYGGTGLGLAITKNLIEVQGGKIWVESRPRKGSSFHFSLSYEKCKESQKKLLGPKPAVRNELGDLRILLAEDNEVNQLLTKGMLEFLGFRIRIASNGKQAVEFIDREDFDLVLMDIQMPEKNGFEATKDIRNNHDHNRRNIPIIALTANALQGEEKKYIAAGMNGFLTKPFTESSLYEIIANVYNKTTSFASLHTETNKQENMALPGSDEKLYDLSLVSELARGNDEFIMNLAKIFIDTVPVTSSEMTEACRNKKWEQVGKLAHKLKSTIDTMCISSLKDDIRLIEKNGKDQKNLDNIPALVEKADTVIKKVAAQLKAEFKL
jgi:PAS domain S-box-containing protein